MKAASAPASPSRAGRDRDCQRLRLRCGPAVMIQTPDPDVSWSSSRPKEVLSEVLCHSPTCLYYKISLSSSASLSKAYSPGLLKVAWLLRLTQMFGLQGWKLGWRSGKEIPLWAAVGRRVSIECGRRKEQKTGVNCSKNTEEKRWKKIHQNGFSVDSCVQPRWIWNQTCIYSTFKMKLFLFFILNGLNWN